MLDYGLQVWKPRRYQKDMDPQRAIDQWAPGYDYEDGGEQKTMFNGNDIGMPFTLAECRAECERRNAEQIARARSKVAELESALATAREHLSRVEIAHAK